MATCQTQKRGRRFHSKKKHRTIKKHDELKSTFNQTIVNISEYNPTFSELALLSKGLSFCPRGKAPEDIDLLSDIFQFLRKIRLKHFFRNKDDTPIDPFDSLCKQSKGWTPPPGQNPQLERFVSCLVHETTEYKHPGNGTNLTYSEIEAIKSLKSNKDIVIKPSDKGGAIVIWGKGAYIEMRQINSCLTKTSIERSAETIHKPLTRKSMIFCKSPSPKEICTLISGITSRSKNRVLHASTCCQKFIKRGTPEDP
jgi:hypothetical protein